MNIRKSYKVRLYPNKAQELELIKILDGCTFVWNYFLKKRKNHYLETRENLSFMNLSREIKYLRKTAPELKGVQAAPLFQSLRRLESAYKRFFGKVSKFPNFKKTQDVRRSFDKYQDWKIVGNKIQIQKNLVIKTKGTLPLGVERITRLVVKLEAGKWFASIGSEEELQPAAQFSESIGVDVGLHHLAVLSNGEKFETYKPGYELHHGLKKLQQKLARQEIGSKRRAVTKMQIARLYQKMSSCRLNHLHQTSRKILEGNPTLVAIEDLNVRGLMSNRRLSRSLSDVSLGELHRQLKYKQEWRGGEVVKIDRFFPSTKTCSGCGYVNEEMTLATRNWTCPRCGEAHDRDINAAKVILQRGLGKPRAEVAIG